MNEKQRLRGNLQNRTNSWLECEQVIGHLRKQIAGLEQERDELRQTITHLENGWKIDSDSFEECQIENARLRVLIHDKNKAIGGVANQLHEENLYGASDELNRIAAMTTDDGPIQIPPEYRDETDKQLRDKTKELRIKKSEFLEHYLVGCLVHMSNDDDYIVVRTYGAVDNLKHCVLKKEIAEEPSHKCQNNIDAATGECAVCGEDAEVADDVWMNAPMGSPSDDYNSVLLRGIGTMSATYDDQSSEDAPPDAPTCHNSDCQYYDTNEAGNCGASEEFGVLVPISECHDAILSPPDASPDVWWTCSNCGNKSDFFQPVCPKCKSDSGYRKDGPSATRGASSDAPSDEVMRVSPRNPEVAVVVNANADAIERLQQQIETVSSSLSELERRHEDDNTRRLDDINANADAIEKMQRELEVGRANDRYFNEKLDYIGEMKEEIQQQNNSHTAIVHGEIERRLTEMGQQINQLNSDDKMMAEGVNATGRAMQQQIDSLKHGCTLADALRQGIDDIARLEERIIELEQRISGEKGE